MNNALPKIKLSLTLICVLFCFFLNAQVKTKVFKGEIPDQFKPTMISISKEMLFYPPNGFNELINKKDDVIDNTFALSLPVGINILDEAKSSEIGNFREYTLRIIAEGALNISIQFGLFKLSENAELSIYSENELTDSITSRENNQNNIWATRVYQGEMLNIVLKEPLNEKEHSLITVSNVNFGYKNYGIEFGHPGASVTCEINANCPAGNGWDNEKNSIALIVANGSTACTGSLIMNTCNTNTPYLLTANHCLVAGNVNNWVFQFQYLSTTCDPNSGWREDIQYNGCQLRASGSSSDFALLQLNQTPPSNSNLRFAGWSRQTAGMTNTTILHHPAGDLMKITRDINPPTFSTFMNAQCWHLQIDLGATEEGTSGAPYFDQNHRIIGQHFGIDDGTLPICQRTSKHGGRFNVSWTGGGTNATRLSNWLDPNNSGVLTTNTTNISALYSANPTLSITGSPTNDYICSGSSTYTLSGLPANATNTWTLDGTAVASIPNPSTGSSVVVTKTGIGVVTLTANVVLCGGGTRAVIKTIMVGASVAGYYRIYSNYHNPGIFYPLYNNNSAIWLPANQTCGVDVYLTSPALQSATWTRATSSYPFNWNTSGTFLSFAGVAGTTAYQQRNGVFNLTAQTTCGTYNGTFTWPIIVQGYGYFQIESSPNPATNLITVNTSDESPDVKALSKNENVIIQMYSFDQTRLIKQWQFKNDQNQYNLNVSELQKGYYVLIVHKGNFKQSKKVLIQK